MLLHPVDSEPSCRRTGLFPRSTRTTTTVPAEALTGRRLLGPDMGRRVLHRRRLPEVCRTHRAGRALPLPPKSPILNFPLHLPDPTRGGKCAELSKAPPRRFVRHTHRANLCPVTATLIVWYDADLTLSAPTASCRA